MTKRWEYKAEKPLHLLVVRVYRLAKGHLHEYDERYAGCHSWVDLTESIPTGEGKPILSDPEFQKKVAELPL